jgi:hypothetical protein
LDSPFLCLFWVPLLHSSLTCIYMRLSDGNLVLVPLVSRGIDKNNTALVHAGFLISYNSVRAVVVHVVRDQLLAFPNYTVVISGSPPFFCFLCVLVNGWCRTLVGWRTCVPRCSVGQIKYPVSGSSVVHLWYVFCVS